MVYSSYRLQLLAGRVSVCYGLESRKRKVKISIPDSFLHIVVLEQTLISDHVCLNTIFFIPYNFLHIKIFFISYY